MTSIPQHPDPSTQNNIVAPRKPVQNQSPPASQGSISTAAAVGRSSYAAATKNSLPPNASASPSMATAIEGSTPSQHVHDEAMTSVNGNIPVISAIPSLEAPEPMNGGGGVNGGGMSGGPPNKAQNIQFGELNPGGSPASGASPALAHASPANLGVAGAVNPRMISPQASPSPVPRPAVSGGRPPSSLQNQGNPLVFGQSGPDANDQGGHMRGMAPNSYIPSGPHASNLRRASSHSSHGDMGSYNIPGGPGRGGYTMPAGRGGRAGFQGQPYHPQMPFAPQTNYRGGNTQRAMHGVPSFQAHPHPYPSSPSLAGRSPAMANAHPAQPQRPPISMVPGTPGQQYGYSGHQGFPQVNRHISSPNSSVSRGKAGKGKGRGRGTSNLNNSGRGWDRLGAERHGHPPLVPDPALSIPPQQIPVDLSPQSGNFERMILTAKQQGYPPLQLQPDPSLQALYNSGAMQTVPPNHPYPPPASPHPSYTQISGALERRPPPMQHTSSMSRTPSQVSTSERPPSGPGQQPAPAPKVSGRPSSGTTTASPVPKSDFILPPRRNAALIIKNEEGVVQPVKTRPSVSPARATPSPVKAGTPSAPGSRSRSVSTAGVSHGRTDSVNEMSGEAKRKAMQDAVAKKIAEDAKAKEEADPMEHVAPGTLGPKDFAAEAEEDNPSQEDISRMPKTEPRALQAEVKETEAKQSDGEVPVAAQPSSTGPSEKPASAGEHQADKEDDMEKMIQEMEAQEAAREKEEAEREAAYQAKKQAEKEAQKQKEAEEHAAYLETMSQAEKEAEEAEEARELQRAGATAGPDPTKPEVSKEQRAPTPLSVDSPAVHTPAESGAATPVSEVSMPPPARGIAASRREKPAALTLETTKQVEPPQPSAAMKALQSARFLNDPSRIAYPSAVASPNPALNNNAPADRKFKYNKEFLLQFQNVFKEKPSLDWDVRIRDTVGDGADTPARNTSARTPPTLGTRNNPSRSNFPPGFGGGIGPFNPAPRAGPPNFPPGNPSAERFPMPGQAMTGQRGPPMQSNPFAPGRPAGMSLVGSGSRNSGSNALSGQIPGSPRMNSSQGSSHRGKRQNPPRKRAEDESKDMLTASMDLKPIQRSSTGWKPRIGQGGGTGPAPDGHMAPDIVQRKVKGLLNKMTPEKFEKITDQILEIAGQSRNETDGRTLRQVIQLTFEKATDEAHWASTYALFCERMMKFMSLDIKDQEIKDRHGNVVTGGALFRKYLLTRCQEEFERGWKVNMPPKLEGQTEEAALMSEEYYVAAAAKRRGLGLVKFIGELYKLSMLTERIMHECVKKLLELDEGGPDESEVESLVSLLNTVGFYLEQSEKGPAFMNVYFERIVSIMNHPDLPSRLKFKLLDVIDLRKRGWQSKNDDKGPKTIAEIHADAQRKQAEADAERLRQQHSSRGGGGRMTMGRGDVRGFSGGGRGMPPPDYGNNVATDDLRRLNTRAMRNSSNPGGSNLGPSSLVNSGRTNSSRRGLGPGPILNRGEDSGASSRTGTPPQREKEKKEDGDKSSTNTYSALATLEGESTNQAASPPSARSSPPTTKLRPTVEQQRSKSPEKGNA